MNQLSELGHEATKLAAMLEGLDVLIDAGAGMEQDPTAKMARNSLPSMIEMLIEKAWALNNAIEAAEMEERKSRMEAERAAA